MLVLGGDKCRQYLGRLDATCIALVSFDLKPTPLAEICHGSWGWLPTELEVEEAVKRVDEGERSKKKSNKLKTNGREEAEFSERATYIISGQNAPVFPHVNVGRTTWK